MFNLPVRTWILNAAAVFSRQHGAVTRQAEQSGCSRETVYEHARKVERRLADEPDGDVLVKLRAANQRLHEVTAGLKREVEGRVVLDKDKQRQFATTAFAMGVSLRQVENLLGVLLPAEEAPDHTTLGRWVAEEVQRAGAILAALDPACVGRVETLAIDEIFFNDPRKS